MHLFLKIMALCSVALLSQGLQAAETDAITETNKPLRPFLVNTGFTPPVSDLYAAVLREAGASIGLDVQTLVVSAERSLRLVNDGEADAECCRINKVIEQSYPDLVPLSESFYEINWVAFSKDKSIQLKDWDDLKNYSVAAVTGWKLAVIQVKRVNPKRHFILATQESMFSMLERDRIDLGVGAMLSGMQVIHDMNLKNIHVLQPPLAKMPLFMQLHPRNRDLAEPFSAAIAKMKQNGRVDEIMQEVMQKLQ